MNIKKERLQATMKMLKKILKKLDSIDPEDFVPEGDFQSSQWAKKELRVVGELGDEQKKLLILLDQIKRDFFSALHEKKSIDVAAELTSRTNIVVEMLGYSLRDASDIWESQVVLKVFGEEIVAIPDRSTGLAVALEILTEQPAAGPKLSDLGGGGDPVCN